LGDDYLARRHTACSVAEAADVVSSQRFGYSPGAFRVLCHAFRRRELPEFFATARTGPREQPKKSRAREQIVALRKRNYSTLWGHHYLNAVDRPIYRKRHLWSAGLAQKRLREMAVCVRFRKFDTSVPSRIR
jgi:hypothetical protein